MLVRYNQAALKRMYGMQVLSMEEIGMLRILAMVLVGLMVFAAGCDDGGSDGDKKQSQDGVEQVASSVVSDSPKLLFFMNPRGMPCRTQDGIVKQVMADNEGVVELVYVKTHNESDRQVFYKYGIRSLPCLVLTKGDGTVIKRFSPGVQEASVIEEAIGALK